MSVGAVNKQTGERIPTAGMPAVDSVLSGTSTNPVQNKVVKAALDDKADTDMVAADFDATASYTAGNYCVQDGKLYKFKNNHSGAWSAADVDEVKITGELSALKSGLTNATKDVTSEFTLAVSTLEDVFFTVEDDPVSKTITIHITGNSNVGFPNGGITITAPSKYGHNIPNGVVLGAGGLARSYDDTYAFVVAVTSYDGVGLIVNYSQSITAANLSFICSYRYM